MHYEDWNGKLNDLTPHSFKTWRGKHMLLPTARQVDDFIRAIPKGRGVDVRTLKAELAAANGAEVTCPVTVGYHLRTAAEAAWLAHEQGAALEDITPFWRVIDRTVPTAKRLACGLEFLAQQRMAEGLQP